MRKLIGLAAMVALAVFLFAACEQQAQEVIVITKNDVESGAPLPIFMPHADRSEIQKYFPNRTKGDLYIGEIVDIRLVNIGDNDMLYLKYSNGMIISPGLLHRTMAVAPGCWVLLFNKVDGDNGIPSLDRMKPCLQ